MQRLARKESPIPGQIRPITKDVFFQRCVSKCKLPASFPHSQYGTDSQRIKTLFPNEGIGHAQQPLVAPNVKENIHHRQKKPRCRRRWISRIKNRKSYCDLILASQSYTIFAPKNEICGDRSKHRDEGNHIFAPVWRANLKVHTRPKAHGPMYAQQPQGRASTARDRQPRRAAMGSGLFAHRAAPGNC